MAKTLNILLASCFLILAIISIYAQVPSVPDPVCAGGWNIHGVFYPREQGGCCRGTECCKYEGFKDMPACVPNAPKCTGADCCKYAEYKDTPLCIISFPPGGETTPENNASPEKNATPEKNTTADSADTCSGLDCCMYSEYKSTPLCSGAPESGEGCSGLDCCKLDKYKDTPLCIITPPTNPPPTECDPIPPKCPVGGMAPQLVDPSITSGSKCRGACGGDCPATCTHEEVRGVCIADSTGKCFYECTYPDVISCGSHPSCRTHDDCYDACAVEKGEKKMCLQGGWCHCACDFGCVTTSPPWDCIAFALGGGPNDKKILYSEPPMRSSALNACP